jgi:outer membrane protein OmpA-like peptidoglycan-associated protein
MRNYLWVGGFTGLGLYDALQDVWINIPHALFQEHGVSAVAVDGSKIWVGTELGGVLVGQTNKTFIRLNIPRRFIGNETATWQGEVQGEGKLDCSLEYRVKESGQPWKKCNDADLIVRERNLEGKTELKSLPDNLYQFRVSVTDSLGKSNHETFSLHKAVKALKITFPVSSLHCGKMQISGEYQPLTLEKITITPGNIKATLNPETGNFSAALELSSGMPELRFRLEDASGRFQEYYFPITLTPAPEISISTSRPIFNPDIDTVQFALEGKNAGALKSWEVTVSGQDWSVVRVFKGRDELPASISWDGKNDLGQTVPKGRMFYYALGIEETSGWKAGSLIRVIRSESPPESTDVAGNSKPAEGLKLEEPFFFDSGQVLLKPAYCKILDTVIPKQIQNNPKTVILIEGYADDTPIHTAAFDNNQILSEMRAQEVAKYLVSQGYALPGQIATIGYGDINAALHKEKQLSYMENRRVEVTLINK